MPNLHLELPHELESCRVAVRDLDESETTINRVDRIGNVLNGARRRVIASMEVHELAVPVVRVRVAELWKGVTVNTTLGLGFVACGS